MAMTFLGSSILSNHPPQVKVAPYIPSFRTSKQRFVFSCRADPYVDYKSSPKSVFPAEACDTVGGESCQGKIGSEVKLKAPDSSSFSSKQEKEEEEEGVTVDREYVEYNSNPKTVFPGEACDDLGGEFCDPDYQSGVFKEKK